MKNFMQKLGEMVSNALCREPALDSIIDGVDVNLFDTTDDTVHLVARKYTRESSTEYTITITRKVNRYSDDD